MSKYLPTIVILKTSLFHPASFNLLKKTLVIFMSLGLSFQSCALDSLNPSDQVEVKSPSFLPSNFLPAKRIPIGIPGDYKPCIAKLPNGNLLLVAFHAPTEGGVPKEYSFLYRSSDGGHTWSERKVLDILGREPYLSVISDGTVFISTHLLPKARGNDQGYTQSYLYRSTDGGSNWTATHIGFEDLEGVKEKSLVITGRNVLELENGSLIFGVGAPNGYEYLWKSFDKGKTWNRSLTCHFQGVDQKILPFPILGEAFFWETPSKAILAVCRISPKFFSALPGTTIPKNKIDHYERMVLYRSEDEGRNWFLEEIGSYYGEMYPSILRLRDGRLLFTFTVRAAVAPASPPLGVQAAFGEETNNGVDFTFNKDRIILDDKTPPGKLSGGGFGPTVQVDDETLVTSYSYSSLTQETHLEIVRWKIPSR